MKEKITTKRKTTKTKSKTDASPIREALKEKLKQSITKAEAGLIFLKVMLESIEKAPDDYILSCQKLIEDIK